MNGFNMEMRTEQAKIAQLFYNPLSNTPLDYYAP